MLPTPAIKPFSLYQKQADYWQSTATFRAFVGGIGSGKSKVGAFDLITRALQQRGTYMVVGPTYTSLSRSSLKTFLDLARELGVLDARSVRASAPPTAALRNGSQILFGSGDNPDSLRGPNLSGVWMDEASLMTREVYDILIGRLRESKDRMGWLGCTFTPKGPTHWTYETFATGRPDTLLIRARTRDNPFLPPDFVAKLRLQYSEQWARQELDGEFIQIEGAVFPAIWFDFPGFMCPAWPATGITRTVMYLDPSQGKDSDSTDDQVYVRAGFYPGTNHENLIYLQCVAHQEPPGQMVARGVRLVRDWKPNLWVYEINGTMGLLTSEINRQCGQAALITPTLPITNTDPKRWRIRSQFWPQLERRGVRIVDNPGGRLLRAQLLDEPYSEHDDCSDAAAGALQYLNSLIAGG